MQELKQELKSLIVTALELEDVTPDSIESDADLFGEGDGLALDSIDALELAVALSKKYGVTLKAEDAATRDAFRSVSSLATYVADHRTDS